MGVEREVKLRIEHSEFLTLLEGRGFKYNIVETEEQEDLYFDNPSCDLLLEDRVFRLRRSSGTVKVAYKGPREAMGAEKIREEIEGVLGSEECSKALQRIGICTECPENEENLVRLLRENGFDVKIVVKKERKRIEVRGVPLKITLDNVEGLGEFVEVEGIGSLEFAKSLGLTCNAVIPSYAHLIHALKHGIHS
ncbi:MAG: class IV adenylate cyclase [Candidatus Korarchaeota archaeon]|nr:class IV adenylate cyclase [Candidatus Korarchaeota archaeon]